MSVAFRREGDDEHKEPRFELPLPAGPNIVTPRGKALIDARVADLEAAIAAGGSDEAIAEHKRDLRYWSTRQSTAQVAPPASGDEAAIGTRVTYRLRGGKPATIEIVGHDEADPATGKLAFASPLARAMIGAGEGELVDFGGEEEAIEVLKVAVAD